MQIALATPEAIDLARKITFDLVISNLGKDVTMRLDRCGAVYFAFPSEELSKEYGGNIEQFNVRTKEKPPAGFAMAEKLAEEFPDRFGDTQRPRIIFYAGKSGGIAASQCGRIVTSRPDILLQSVVSALAEFRWKKLTSLKTQNKQVQVAPTP